MVSKITYFFEYLKFLKNPIDCLLFKFNIKKSVVVYFKDNNYKINLNHISSINHLMNYLRLNKIDNDLIYYLNGYDSDDEIINVTSDIMIYNPRHYKLNEIFLEYFLDYYSDFDINYEDRIIVDIGANSGDSALYFASKGAKVYAFEPVKEYYDMALKNFEVNPKLANNIKIFNYGVSYKNGKININSMESASSYVGEDSSYEVDIISMDSIIEKIDVDLLKIDCEGCEFEIIENTDLSSFNEIVFEYHSKITGKNHEQLINKLKSEGFNIERSSVFNEPMDELGLIHAYKRGL